FPWGVRLVRKFEVRRGVASPQHRLLFLSSAQAVRVARHPRPPGWQPHSKRSPAAADHVRSRPDLYHPALIETGVALGRAKGPDGVVLREVARQTRVSHIAAYRHFADRDERLHEAARCGLAELSEMMRAHSAAPTSPSSSTASTTACAPASGPGQPRMSRTMAARTRPRTIAATPTRRRGSWSPPR